MKPFLFDIVDKAYHGVMDNVPKELQERSMASAFTLGFAGSYVLVKSIQLLSEKTMSEKFNNLFIRASL